MTFRELVDAFESHREPSCMPARGDTGEWFSSGYEMRDYRTGTERETTIHYSRKNPERMAKYWRKAAIVAGVVRA